MGHNSKNVEMKLNECDDIDVDIDSIRKPKGSKLSTQDKLRNFNVDKIDKSKDGKLLDPALIKNQVFVLSHTDEGVCRVLETHDKILKRRALGAAPVYTTKVITTKKGIRKEVQVKEEFMAGLKWAKKPSTKGGGSTQYTSIEGIVLMGALYVCAVYYGYLKMNTDLPITAAGNIGKVYRIYVMIMIILSYGGKYPDYVVLRTLASITKKVTWGMNKENMHPDAVNIRTIVHVFANPKCVSKTSMVVHYLHKSVSMF